MVTNEDEEGETFEANNLIVEDHDDYVYPNLFKSHLDTTVSHGDTICMLRGG